MNWHKVIGIVMIILGIIILVGSSIVVVPIDESEGEPWKVDPTGFYISTGLGAILIALGAYLYYLGHRKQKKEASASPPRNT